MPDEEEALRQVDLGSSREPSGFTRHYDNNRLLPPPQSLQVVRYPGDPGFYLFYLASSGDVQADTWHETLADALDQARLEFGVLPDEWSRPAP